MFSRKNKAKVLCLNLIGIPVMFIALFDGSIITAQANPGSIKASADTLIIAPIDTIFYRIKGKAAYGNGTLVSDAQVMLLDTLEKTLQITRSSQKLFKRYFGGNFKFEGIPPGEYIISVDLGTRVGIKRRIIVEDKNLNVGTIFNEVEFPKYEVGDYTDSTRIYHTRIPVDPIEPDSINVRHIIIDLEGNANTVKIDSVLRDSLFFTTSGTLYRDSIPIDTTYLIYNDYGIILHKSRSFRNRIQEVQKRDGFIVFHSNDTLKFDNIYFDESLRSPSVATFHFNDSIGMPKYHSFFDIYKIYTGSSYIERSIQRGFKTGLYMYGGLAALQIYQKKSFNPLLDYLPNFNPDKKTGSSFYPMITSFSIFTLGWVGYDWYMDRRSNYLTPKDEENPFPKSMFVFSGEEWLAIKMKPFANRIKETPQVQWWVKRKEEKKKRKRAKRKTLFD